MLNSLELSNNLMVKASEIIDRNEQDKEGKHHGIILRSFGYQYWKFFKKAKADDYLNKALVIFEKIKSPYLVSTIYKEKGDMHKELQEAEQAQNCYEQCIRLRRQAFGEGAHFTTEKIYFRLADNMMKERCNDGKLRRAAAYLQRDHDMLMEILELGNDQEELECPSLFLAMHYQFKGKLAARHIDKEGCISNYKRSEEIFIKAYNGERSLVMQSFY